mmetsp:Transcript_34941/g.91733  ORF Transcript_34941/g.91733 Transcript_34941/m.91733 type:complete len:81 (-) Transcript_34941:436-678(-)|eukprot:CAMPEP_0115866836 /NCGR_PEP_ID=MMETSP0287-20121206/20457_1 /TAXON_ID=412157 /ORGANISM="Chrysochromulina rotalis, Strain UIO044" /LENGTH=80 /DNA_ID=CAMNT_0003321421 /DNA_START=72 /DNA_END=314 /DNA_ORIENTATION=+
MDKTQPKIQDEATKLQPFFEDAVEQVGKFLQLFCLPFDPELREKFLAAKSPPPPAEPPMTSKHCLTCCLPKPPLQSDPLV